jgi:uncharacterized membrane protein (DUF106 family)
MDTLGRILTFCGDAARGAGRYLLEGLAWLWSLIDELLQPVLSPVLAWLNPPCVQIGDAAYQLLAPLPPWAGLTILSIVAGVVMLIAFKFLSNQKAIARAKDDIKANLLALKLFKDDIGVTFRCQWRLFKAIVRLQRYVLTPVLILLPPMLLVLAQMGIRYQWRALRVGDQALVTLTLDPAYELPAQAVLSAASRTVRADPGDPPTTPLPITVGTNMSVTSMTLRESPGVEVEVDGIPGGGKIVWRVRGVEPGRHMLVFVAPDGTAMPKEIVIGDEAIARVSPIRPASRWTQQLLHPVEAPVPPVRVGGGVQAIEIGYPFREHWFHGANWWVLSFFVVSMLTAIVLKPVFGVRF